MVNVALAACKQEKVDHLPVRSEAFVSTHRYSWEDSSFFLQYFCHWLNPELKLLSLVIPLAKLLDCNDAGILGMPAKLGCDVIFEVEMLRVPSFLEISLISDLKDRQMRDGISIEPPKGAEFCFTSFYVKWFFFFQLYSFSLSGWSKPALKWFPYPMESLSLRWKRISRNWMEPRHPYHHSRLLSRNSIYGRRTGSWCVQSLRHHSPGVLRTLSEKRKLFSYLGSAHFLVLLILTSRNVWGVSIVKHFDRRDQRPSNWIR